MIHRSRRHLATLPARRGMRAHWLRRRDVEESDVASPLLDRDDTGPPTADAADGDPPPGAQAAPGPVRPAFGHPTF